MAAATAHPVWQHLIEKGMVTVDELKQVRSGCDMITAGTFFESEPRYYMPDEAPEHSEERVVYTSLDAEKIAENREAYEADQFRLHRSSVLPLSGTDESRGHLVDEAWRRSDAAVDFEAEGVAIEYRRRATGRQPWMSKHSWSHWKRCDDERKAKLAQRREIVDLLTKIGRDPRSEKVAEWVRERGYDAALSALRVAAARETVAA